MSQKPLTPQSPIFPEYWNDFLENMSRDGRVALSTLPVSKLDHLKNGYAHRMRLDLNGGFPDDVSKEERIVRNMALFNEIREGYDSKAQARIPGYMGAPLRGEFHPEVKQLIKKTDEWLEPNSYPTKREEFQTGKGLLEDPFIRQGIRSILRDGERDNFVSDGLKGLGGNSDNKNSFLIPNPNPSPLKIVPKKTPPKLVKSDVKTPALPQLNYSTINSSIPTKKLDFLDKSQEVDLGFEWASSEFLNWLDTEMGQHAINAIMGASNAAANIPTLGFDVGYGKAIREWHSYTGATKFYDPESTSYILADLITGAVIPTGVAGKAALGQSFVAKGPSIARKLANIRAKYIKSIKALKARRSAWEAAGMSMEQIAFEAYWRRKAIGRKLKLEMPKEIREIVLKRNQKKYVDDWGPSWEKLLVENKMDYEKIYQKSVDSTNFWMNLLFLPIKVN